MKVLNLIKNMWVRTDSYLRAKTSSSTTPNEPIKFEDLDFSQFSQTSGDSFEKEDNTRRIGWVAVASFLLFMFSVQFNYFDFYNLGFILLTIFLLSIIIWLFRKAD